MSYPFNASTVNEIFHRYHMPGMNVLYNQEYWFWNSVMDSGSDPSISIEQNEFQGTQAKFALEMTRQGGFGSLSDGGTLRDGMPYEVAIASEFIREVQQPATITGAAIRLSRNDLGSYTRALGNTTRNSMQAMMQKLSWLCYAAPAGVLAQVSAGGTLTATGVEIDFDNNQVDFQNFLVDMVGERFAFVTATQLNQTATFSKANFTVGTLKSVHATDKSATFTLVSGYGTVVANNDYLVLGDVDNAANLAKNAYNNRTGKWNGLGSIIDSTGDLHGVSVTTYPRWKSYEKALSSSVDEYVFNAPIRQVQVNSGALDNVCAIMNPAAADVYADTMKSLRRYNNTTEMTGGRNVQMAQAGSVAVPIKSDIYCQEKVVYIVDKGNIISFKVDPGIQYIQNPDDNRVWKQNIATDGKRKDSYSMWMRVSMALGTKHRNRHAKLTSFD